ncbi:MAG: hypothetical protein LC775_11515 [Acidobacteria bacterium]|nr:hypothetical protein [Acidobacteriota bacterium]
MQRGHNREPEFFGEKDYSTYLHLPLGSGLKQKKPARWSRTAWRCLALVRCATVSTSALSFFGSFRGCSHTELNQARIPDRALCDALRVGRVLMP